MAIGNQAMVLHILADDRVLERVLKKSQNEINSFSKNVETAGKKNQAALSGGFFGRGAKGNQALRGLASGTGLGSAALFGSGAFIGSAVSATALKASIDAASNLNEQITKTQQVFGDSSRAIEKWSQDTATNMGIGQTAALQAAATFGNLFKAQGIGDAKNSQLSRNLVQLAADLASFNNIDPSQVLQDLQSAIVGEIEPVRKYGADLRVARVQQEALAESGKQNVKELTRQELTLARLSLLYKDTNAAQGDFARTSGGLANQQRILTAQVQDLASDLGTLLLPAVGGVVTGINQALVVVLKLTDGLKRLGEVKIPEIHIPFFFDFPGGGKVSGIAGKVAKFGGLAAVSPLGAVVKTVHDQVVGDAKKQVDVDTPKLAKEFKDILGGFTSDAIDDALQGGSFIKTNKKVTPKQFESILSGLDLGLDKAQLTTSLTDDLAVLKRTKTIIQAQIAAGIDVANAKKKLVAVQKQIADTQADIRAKPFENLLDSLSLGVERSQINGSLQSQLAALQALEAGIQKQIKAGVDVQSAQHQLAAVQAQIASTQQQIKQEGIDKTLGALQSAVDRATLTKTLADDLKALQAQAAGLRAQIRAGNDIANNQSQLISVLQSIASLQEEISQKQKDAQKSRLFRQIGLTGEGTEIIPGVANLKKQFEQLSKQDLSGVSKKLTNRLAGVAKALKDPLLKALPDVRSAIRDLFQEIRGEFDKQTNGPLTKTTSLNTNKVLKGLGLDAATRKELSGRLSKFNSAGVALAGPGVVAATRSGFPAFGTAPTINVNVELDGKQVARSVTVQQQKRKRRNSSQKRGPTVAHGGV